MGIDVGTLVPEPDIAVLLKINVEVEWLLCTSMHYFALIRFKQKLRPAESKTYAFIVHAEVPLPTGGTRTAQLNSSEKGGLTSTEQLHVP